MSAGFPLFHGIPGTLARAFQGKLALAPILAVACTWALIASGADDAVRDGIVEHLGYGHTEVRFAELYVGILWPILPALLLVRRGYWTKDRERMAAGCAIGQAVLVGFVLTMALKFATGRPMPASAEPARAFYGLALENARQVRLMWPSGHTSESFVAASTIAAFWPERRRLRALVYAIASLVGLSMVLSTFHWLSDVVAAIFLATPIGWSTGTTFRRWVGRMDRFQLTSSGGSVKGTRLVLELGDLTKARVDAIVNAANETMLGGGGVDGAIHRAAGKALVAACRLVPEVSPGVRCPTGEARITPGFLLPAKHVIHTVGPVYESAAKSAPILASAYRSALLLARENGLKTVAFPAISCGIFGYPLGEGAKVALEACRAHAGPPIEEVRFVLFSAEVYSAWLEAARTLSA